MDRRYPHPRPSLADLELVEAAESERIKRRRLNNMGIVIQQNEQQNNLPPLWQRAPSAAAAGDVELNNQDLTTLLLRERMLAAAGNSNTGSGFALEDADPFASTAALQQRLLLGAGTGSNSSGNELAQHLRHRQGLLDRQLQLRRLQQQVEEAASNSGLHFPSSSASAYASLFNSSSNNNGNSQQHFANSLLLEQALQSHHRAVGLNEQLSQHLQPQQHQPLGLGSSSILALPNMQQQHSLTDAEQQQLLHLVSSMPSTTTSTGVDGTSSATLLVRLQQERAALLNALPAAAQTSTTATSGAAASLQSLALARAAAAAAGGSFSTSNRDLLLAAAAGSGAGMNMNSATSSRSSNAQHYFGISIPGAPGNNTGHFGAAGMPNLAATTTTASSTADGGGPGSNNKNCTPLDNKTGRQPIHLYMSCDDDDLSPYQCLVRKQIELFEAEEVDAESNARGRNRPIVVGQVGIRCKHCKMLPPRKRERAAIYYPSKLDRLYQAGQTMASVHLGQYCNHIPEHIRKELARLREGKSAALAGKKYWSDGARALGVYEEDERLFFRQQR